MDHGCCSDGITKLDLSVFTSVKRIEIGNGCFHSVTEVVIVGLPCVEVVHIGDYSFTMQEEEEEFLKTGDFDGLNVTIPYKKAVIPYCAELSPIKDTPSLETIKLGDVSFSLSSGCFMYSDLQLRSPSVCLLSR